MSTELIERCPLCGGRVAPHWPVVNVWRCGACGLMFRNPVPDEDELHRLYARSWNPASLRRDETGGTSPSLARIYARRLARSLGRRHLKGLTILDFGAGRGELLAAMSSMGADVYGVEPYGYDHLVRAGFRAVRTAGELPPGLRFDVVTTVDVVEHLPRPWDQLARLKGLLEEDGILYVATMNARGLNARLTGPGWREARKPGHITFFTAGSLEETLRRSGFVRPRRLRWLIPHGTGPVGNCLHFALQALRLDGELRFTARKPGTSRR